MFKNILHPIAYLRRYCRVWKEITAEELAILESETMSDEVKDAVVKQIRKRAFPEVAL